MNCENPPNLVLKSLARQFVPSADITITPERVRRRLEELTGVVPMEVGGREVRLGERRTEEGKALAREYLTQEYERLGFVVTEQPCSPSDSVNHTSGVNLIAEKAGASRGFVIVSSHYDTAVCDQPSCEGQDTVGADDDGSGIVAGLLVAEALSKSELQSSVEDLSL